MSLMSGSDLPYSAPRQRRAGTMLAALLAVLALLAGGCASYADEQTAPQDRAANFPVTVTPPEGDKLTLPAPPKRIVSLSPANTEILFGIGAGDQVVAVDKDSNFPAEAPTSQIDAFTPNIEAIAEYKPDLVVASDDLGGLVKKLRQVDIPLLLAPAPEDLQQTYALWRMLGKATGNTEKANQVVQQVSGEVRASTESVPKPAKPLTYYYELDPELHSVTSETFIGKLYAEFGLRNIADSAKAGSLAGYPKLSAEQVIKANPDLIFLADTQCCDASPDSVAARPGWDVLSAVREDTVIALNDDVASRWGPRLLQLVRAVGAAVLKADTAGGQR